MNSQHPYWLIVASTALALTPIAVGLCTSFIKVHVVLSFFRSGLGAQQVPSGTVIFGIATALTLSIMSGTFEEFQQEWKEFPVEYLDHSPEKVKSEDIQKLLSPWKKFLVMHTGERELRVFREIGSLSHQSARSGENAELKKRSTEALLVKESEKGEISTSDRGAEVGWSVLLPAFVVTELREAFLIGFIVLLPFLAVDLIIANTLAGIGMFMVSPILISLPLKVALFTFSDGWLLLTRGLAESYVLGGG